MRETGNYIGRHDADHAEATLEWGADSARHYQPRRLAGPEAHDQPRLTELSVTRHQPRHAAA